MAKFTIFERRHDFSSFEGLASRFQEYNADPLYGKFGRRYYPTLLGKAYVDTSFLVQMDDTPILLAESDVSNDVLARYGLPIRVLDSTLSLGDRERGEAFRCLFRQFDKIAVEFGATSLIIDDFDSKAVVSCLGLEAIARKGRMDSNLRGLCDLRLTEPEIRKSVRESYKSLINWGQRNIELRYVTLDSQDRELFDLFQKLHLSASGGSTRNAQSWDAMFEAICDGDGELSIGFLDGCCVTATLVVDGLSNSFYASAAYDRTRFDKPLSHWPVYNAIMRSKGRGLHIFDFGVLWMDYAADVKHYNVDRFKRGFTTSLAPYITWTCSFSK
ncbi:conserved hypothetical protein [Rhodospirillaceae bacterium LM-1]|nr:conserved hypothetical protein [Rhodospirillaceae bacterium LM-1]